MSTSYSLADVHNWHDWGQPSYTTFNNPLQVANMTFCCSNTAWFSLPVCFRSSHQHGDKGSYEAAGPSAAARQLGNELSCNL